LVIGVFPTALMLSIHFPPTFILDKTASPPRKQQAGEAGPLSIQMQIATADHHRPSNHIIFIFSSSAKIVCASLLSSYNLFSTFSRGQKTKKERRGWGSQIFKEQGEQIRWELHQQI
jgi:hypothetical protein